MKDRESPLRWTRRTLRISHGKWDSSSFPPAPLWWRAFAVLCASLAISSAALAQSTNTSTIVVLVTDQSGAVIKDAKVSVTNTETGAVREAASGSDGSATVPALPLTGAYTVSVAKEGFGREERKAVTLRAGETATLKVKLLVGSQQAEVTVYGTNQGVRADSQIGRRLDGPTIDDTPILGRKLT